jgi:putative endonuclease
LVEQLTLNQWVAGSNPAGETGVFRGVAQLASVPRSGRGGRKFESSHPDYCASLAQLVEQLIRNEQVVGSSPMRGSMDYHIYILYSSILNKYYIGSTNNIDRRLYEHNIGHSVYTKKGIPWELKGEKSFSSLGEARAEELRIKKCKSRKYIETYLAKLVEHPDM